MKGMVHTALYIVRAQLWLIEWVVINMEMLHIWYIYVAQFIS